MAHFGEVLPISLAGSEEVKIYTGMRIPVYILSCASQGRQNYLNYFGPRKNGVCIHTFYEKYDACFASGYKAHASLMIHTRHDRPCL